MSKEETKELLHELKDEGWKERQKIWMKKIGTFDAFMKSLLNQNKDEQKS